ncbi:MAG TPA: VOC family protein [Vineibacter sp.]|nr:VOC family protein [Vineibacter sp.]
MPAPMKLAYLLFDVRRPDRWADFATRTLGLPHGAANTDGSQGYRLDDAAQRLIVRAGKADDLAALGLELADDRALEALATRLAAGGTAVRWGDDAVLAARRVRRLLAFTDPEGTGVEAVVAPAPAATPFASELMSGGFKSDDTGFGHAVLVVRDLGAMERFYVDTLGFAVSERLDTRVGPLQVRGTFLHCNRRHHSLALFALPLRRKLHHFMLQARELADVGRAFERARRERVKLSLGLGQHPDPDGTFSFYGATPSGFDFEIGAGGKEIDPADWQEVRATTTSTWGHAPTLGLQLRTVRSMLATRLGL